MSHKMVQICLRGLNFVLMILALYLNTDSEYDDTCDNFVMSGVWGGYAVVTLGLLVESGLRKESGVFIELIFLSSATVLNLICATLAFIQFSTGGIYKSEAMNKGLLSALAAVLYSIDVFFLHMP